MFVVALFLKGCRMYSIFQKGGPLMWPILLCSISTMAIFIERMIVLVRAKKYARGPIAAYQSHLKSQNSDDQSYKPDGIVRDLMDLLGSTSSAREDAERMLFRRATIYIRSLEERLNWLAIIGTIAPLLGLLGTVTGMIRVFMGIQSMQGQINPSALAGGIWEALITTAAGLIVAIPTIIIYHFFEDRIDDLSGELKDIIGQILESHQ